jgi:hypothetical protein
MINQFTGDKGDPPFLGERIGPRQLASHLRTALAGPCFALASNCINPAQLGCDQHQSCAFAVPADPPDLHLTAPSGDGVLFTLVGLCSADNQSVLTYYGLDGSSKHNFLGFLALLAAFFFLCAYLCLSFIKHQNR